MNICLMNDCEVDKRSDKVCSSCGRHQGEMDEDCSIIKIEAFDGELLCTECHELLDDVQRWV